jgi:hypothetical protein
MYSFHTTEVETMLYSLDVELAEISRNNSKFDRELTINKTQIPTFGFTLDS